MKIVDRSTAIHNQMDTKSVQNFGKLLGDKPHRLGQVVSMYPELSISMLTDSLRNIYYNPKKGADTFTPINSMAIEWDIDVNFIKHVRISERPTGTDLGKGFRPVTIIMDEKYYDKNDTFALENKQQLFVVRVPRRLGASRWAHDCILVGNDKTAIIDERYVTKGKLTRYRSNYYPELSDRGYTKFTSNTETHRNYLSRHRASSSWTQEYALKKEIFVEASKGKKGERELFKMNKKEKECLDHFLHSRENDCLFSETNYDVHGKCMFQDDDGQDIPMGDGIIPQIEKACDKYSFSNFSSDILDTVMATMREKSDTSLGNTYAIVCNEKMYDMFNKSMRNDQRFNMPESAALFYSKHTGDKIRVGVHYDSYKFAGNTITFMPDKQLSIEYPEHAYGIFLDTGVDLISGRPNISMFSMKGNEMISGNLLGMGGYDGKTSGTVSTSATGSSYHLLGTSSAVMFNPYKSFIIEQNIVD